MPITLTPLVVMNFFICELELLDRILLTEGGKSFFS